MAKKKKGMNIPEKRQLNPGIAPKRAKKKNIKTSK